MKYLVTNCLIVFALLAAGCSSSKNSSEMEAAPPAPVIGSWAMADNANGAINFMAGGDATIDQGSIMTAINRFQNTDRANYNTRLTNTATYSYDAGSNQLTLNVMADWTGKGTGARRAADKSVSSAIVFAIESMEGNTVTLRKVSMSQSGSGTDNTNADETLTLMLAKN